VVELEGDLSVGLVDIVRGQLGGDGFSDQQETSNCQAARNNSMIISSTLFGFHAMLTKLRNRRSTQGGIDRVKSQGWTV
jgi:hypothetical protein